MIGEVLLFSGRRRYYHRGGWIFRRRNEISRVLMLTRVGHEFSIFLQERNHLWSEKSSFSLGGDDFPRENEISLSLSLSRFDNYSYILLFRGKVWRKRRVMKKREEGERGKESRTFLKYLEVFPQDIAHEGRSTCQKGFLPHGTNLFPGHVLPGLYRYTSEGELADGPVQPVSDSCFRPLPRIWNGNSSG